MIAIRMFPVKPEKDYVKNRVPLLTKALTPNNLKKLHLTDLKTSLLCVLLMGDAIE